MVQITEIESQAIAEIRYFKESLYGNLDISGTLDYMTRRYIQPLSKFLDITKCTMADCAAGFGWLSFAFIIAGGGRAILIEPERERILAAEAIAKILGISDRCRFENKLLQELNLETESVNIFSSIETLEHVGKGHVKSCLECIANTAKDAVILSTPNKLFPIVAHDTRLPFAHLLPMWLLQPYAKSFGRADKADGNFFLAPWHLSVLRKKFQPQTPYQTFSTMEEFDQFFPHYLPYRASENVRKRNKPSKKLRTFVWLVGKLFGRQAHTVSPNLSTIWIRR